MKPIVKWAGGKSKLSIEIEKYLPKSIKEYKHINRYIEPFFGGGGFYFYLLNEGYKVDDAIIIDKNNKLMNLYKNIANDFDIVKNHLDYLVNTFNESKDKENFYYNARNDFNKTTDKTKQAVLFLFLNKTCYNGLFRENKKGMFNVPFGKYKKYSFYDLENIKSVSEALKNTKMILGDFKNFGKIEQNDLFYFDPPYIPISETSNFTSYVGEGFNLKDQNDLISTLYKIDKNKGYFILSNSYSEETLELYKDFNISIIEARRSINSKATKRGKVKEIIVRNYK